MQTRKKLKVACLILLGCGAATVCNAQLTLHLVADAASTGNAPGSMGQPVATWVDSASGINVSAAGTAQPTFNSAGPGGQGYVSFDGTDDLLTATVASGAYLSGNQSATMVVLNPDNNLAETILSWRSGAGFDNMWQLSRLSDEIHYVQGDFGQNDQVFATLPTADWSGNWQLLTAIRNTDGSGEIRLNGVSLATSGAFTGPIDNVNGTLMVGGSNFDGVNDRWAGDIAEIRVYNSVPGNINEIELELGGTYGLSVVPEPSEYAMIFGLACVGGALALRYRRQTSMAR